MTIQNDGGEQAPNDLDFGFDDGGLDLSFGNDTPDPADLNAEDMAAGTDEAVVTDLSGKPASAPLQAPAKAAATTPPAPSPTATPNPGATPPAQGQTPAQQQPAAPSAQPGATEQPAPSVSIEEYVAQNAEAIIGNLAGSHFRISDEEAQALGFAPEVREWIEKRDARNYLLTMTQMNTALQKTLPTVVANLVQLTAQVKETEDGFYGEFKELKDAAATNPRLVPFMKQTAQALRMMHPEMGRKEFQTLLGNTVMNTLGIKKAAPATPTGRRITRGQAQPFMPAGAMQPQRNNTPPGGEQLSGLDFINAAMQRD